MSIDVYTLALNLHHGVLFTCMCVILFTCVYESVLHFYDYHNTPNE
jgi:hypothetical protein